MLMLSQRTIGKLNITAATHTATTTTTTKSVAVDADALVAQALPIIGHIFSTTVCFLAAFVVVVVVVALVGVVCDIGIGIGIGGGEQVLHVVLANVFVARVLVAALVQLAHEYGTVEQVVDLALGIGAPHLLRAHVDLVARRHHYADAAARRRRTTGALFSVHLLLFLLRLPSVLTPTRRRGGRRRALVLVLAAALALARSPHERDPVGRVHDQNEQEDDERYEQAEYAKGDEYEQRVLGEYGVEAQAHLDYGRVRLVARVDLVAAAAAAVRDRYRRRCRRRCHLLKLLVAFVIVRGRRRQL